MDALALGSGYKERKNWNTNVIILKMKEKDSQVGKFGIVLILMKNTNSFTKLTKLITICNITQK